MVAKLKNKNTIAKISTLISAVIILAFFTYSYFTAGNYKVDIPSAPEGELSIYFIDVGQGDSELIVSPDGHRLLIDAGTSKSESTLLYFLSGHKCNTIDHAVFTHPHEDHIGGADAVVKKLNVLKILMPDAVSSSVTYQKLLKAIDEKKTDTSVASPGDSFMLGEYVQVKILAPLSIDEDNLNNCSIVLKVEYGENSFIFMGDAETPVESQLLEKYDQSELSSNLIKIGHHGSSTSSSEKFLDAVSPEYAVIECGKNNSYGHPHNEVLERLHDRGVKILRTDESGTMMITSDGKNIALKNDTDKAA